jgi:hypothetical protein
MRSTRTVREEEREKGVRWCKPSVGAVLEFDPDPEKAIAGSLMMLCTRTAVVGEGECDAVEISGTVESEMQWRRGRWRFPSLATPLSQIGIRVCWWGVRLRRTS